MLDKVNFEKKNRYDDELSIYDHENQIIFEVYEKNSPNVSFYLNKTEIKELAIQLFNFLKEK